MITIDDSDDDVPSTRSGPTRRAGNKRKRESDVIEIDLVSSDDEELDFRVATSSSKRRAVGDGKVSRSGGHGSGSSQHSTASRQVAEVIVIDDD